MEIPNIIQILGKENLENAKEYEISNNIVLLVVNTIFSIRANFVRDTLKVIERTKIAASLKGLEDPFKVSEFLNIFGNLSPEELAVDIFKNRQRTSPVNGILKAQAVKEALMILKSLKIETTKDFINKVNDQSLYDGWHNIKGQSSGVTWRYLVMLAGVNTEFKPDTHVYNFFIDVLGYPFKFGNINELEKAFQVEYDMVKKHYPAISIRTLDSLIWKYMSGNEDAD